MYIFKFYSKNERCLWENTAKIGSRANACVPCGRPSYTGRPNALLPLRRSHVENRSCHSYAEKPENLIGSSPGKATSFSGKWSFCI